MKEANRPVGPVLTLADLDSARVVLDRLTQVNGDGALYDDKIARLAVEQSLVLDLAQIIATERTRRRDGLYDAAAVSLGSRGGKARAAALTSDERKAIAQTAGKAPKKARRPRCTDCPHVDYLTVSIERSEHQCDSCGATFVDAAREKRYFGQGVK